MLKNKSVSMQDAAVRCLEILSLTNKEYWMYIRDYSKYIQDYSKYKRDYSKYI